MGSLADQAISFDLNCFLVLKSGGVVQIMKSLWLLVILGVLMVQIVSSTPVDTTDNDSDNNNEHTNSSSSGRSAGGASSLDPADLAVGEQDDDDDVDDDEPPPSSSFVAEIRAHLEGLLLQPTTVTTAKAGGKGMYFV